ncbi:MAG: ABC transporter permease subunit [Bacillota bacterium]|nr:ABC transporter permease subunit [Bacillota bacterium]
MQEARLLRGKIGVRPEAVGLLKICQDPLAFAGLLIVLGFIVVGVLAPFLTPHDPVDANLDQPLLAPCKEYPLGTDQLGRCLLSRIIWGTRVSLATSFIVLLAILGISIPYGLISGWFGGRVDNLLMRIVDVLLAFPNIILALVIAGMLGPSLTNTMLALAGVSWVSFARLIRGLVLQIKKQEFILAARALGASSLWILSRYVLPNVIGPVVVLATLDLGWIILSISGLSFIGLGAQPPTPEWGTMLSDSRAYFQVEPNLMLFPGLAIMLAVLGFNLLGDGLRDVLDPRESVRGKWM